MRWALLGFVAIGAMAGSLSAQESSYSLEEAVAAGLRANRELRIQEYELERTEQLVSEAYGGLWPEVDGTLSLQRNLTVPEAFLPAIIFDPEAGPDDLIPVRFGADNQWTATLEATQTLFDGRVFVGVGAAGRVQTLQSEVVRGQAQTAVTAIRRAYYDVLLAREQLRVTENSIRRVEQTLEETRALNRAGLAGAYDVLRLEVQLANLQPNLRRNANDIAETERELSLEMGMDEVRRVGARGQLYTVDLGGDNGAENLDLLEFVGYPEAETATFERLLEIGLRRRSDVRQAQLQRDVESARVKLERAELMPRVSAFFNFSLIAQENGSLNFFGENSTQRTTATAVGVQVEVPLFSGFSRLNRIDQRQTDLRKADTRLMDLEQRLRAAIRTATEDLREARARAETQRQAVAEAQRGFEIVTAQYLAGTSSRLEVTDAELAVRQSELNYAQAVYDFLNAQAALDLAIGVVPMVDPPVAELPLPAESIEGDE
jgi:outer membrane protein TolC